MKTLSGIEVREANGIFRVPADFSAGFILIPVPDGKLNLFFWEKNRMKRFLKQHGFTPALVTTANSVN